MMNKKLLTFAVLCAAATHLHAASYMQRIDQWTSEYPKTALGLTFAAGVATVPTFSYLKTYATPDRLKALIPSAQIAQEWGMKCTQWVTENRWKSAAIASLGAAGIGYMLYKPQNNALFKQFLINTFSPFKLKAYTFADYKSILERIQEDVIPLFNRRIQDLNTVPNRDIEQNEHLHALNALVAAMTPLKIITDYGHQSIPPHLGSMLSNINKLLALNHKRPDDQTHATLERIAQELKTLTIDLYRTNFAFGLKANQEMLLALCAIARTTGPSKYVSVIRALLDPLQKNILDPSAKKVMEKPTDIIIESALRHVATTPKSQGLETAHRWQQELEQLLRAQTSNDITNAYSILRTSIPEEANSFNPDMIARLNLLRTLLQSAQTNLIAQPNDQLHAEINNALTALSQEAEDACFNYLQPTIINLIRDITGSSSGVLNVRFYPDIEDHFIEFISTIQNPNKHYALFTSVQKILQNATDDKTYNEIARRFNNIIATTLKLSEIPLREMNNTASSAGHYNPWQRARHGLLGTATGNLLYLTPIMRAQPMRTSGTSTQSYAALMDSDLVDLETQAKTLKDAYALQPFIKQPIIQKVLDNVSTSEDARNRATRIFNNAYTRFMQESKGQYYEKSIKYMRKIAEDYTISLDSALIDGLSQTDNFKLFVKSFAASLAEGRRERNPQHIRNHVINLLSEAVLISRSEDHETTEDIRRKKTEHLIALETLIGILEKVPWHHLSTFRSIVEKMAKRYEYPALREIGNGYKDLIKNPRSETSAPEDLLEKCILANVLMAPIEHPLFKVVLEHLEEDLGSTHDYTSPTTLEEKQARQAIAHTLHYVDNNWDISTDLYDQFQSLIKAENNLPTITANLKNALAAITTQEKLDFFTFLQHTAQKTWKLMNNNIHQEQIQDAFKNIEEQVKSIQNNFDNLNSIAIEGKISTAIQTINELSKNGNSDNNFNTRSRNEQVDIITGELSSINTSIRYHENRKIILESIEDAITQLPQEDLDKINIIKQRFNSTASSSGSNAASSSTHKDSDDE